MAIRIEVRELLDAMPAEELAATKRYIEFLQSGHTDMLQWMLDTAPEDDEPTTPEEEAAVEEAWEEYRKEGGVPLGEHQRTLAQ